ncbi:MAG: HTH domain-containing protein [Acidobacteriota bacterium]
MTALEFHQQRPRLELAPILRVIKYMALDSNALSEADVDRILKLYPLFERDPELVVGKQQVCQETDLEPDKLEEILRAHRHEIPFLGNPSHPMVPRVALRMIRAVSAGEDPMRKAEKKLYTLTEMAEQTNISLASLSKYVKEQASRIPSEMVGKMRKFPPEAVIEFQKIKLENLGRRGGGRRRAQRQRATVSRRFAKRFAELEEQLDEAVTVSKQLARTLHRLSKQVRRARTSAESGAKLVPAGGGEPGRGRRSGGRRPDTIVAACKRVLTEAKGPMRVAEITDRVIALGADIRAKNPNVTVSSILSSYDDFSRVRRGYYELAAAEGEAAGAAQSL